MFISNETNYNIHTYVHVYIKGLFSKGKSTQNTMPIQTAPQKIFSNSQT